MTRVTLEVPDSISEQELGLLTALKLFELGRLSMGQAAELASYTKPTFLEVAGSDGVSILSDTAEELEKTRKRSPDAKKP